MPELMIVILSEDGGAATRRSESKDPEVLNSCNQHRETSPLVASRTKLNRSRGELSSAAEK